MKVGIDWIVLFLEIERFCHRPLRHKRLETAKGADKNRVVGPLARPKKLIELS